jgi:hypothetical protein
MTSLVDEKYYEVIKPGGVAESALIKVRDRIFKDFVDRMQPTPLSRILDVGVSDVISDAANVLERSYQFPQKVTACGVGECIEFQREFPSVTYRRIEPHARLPFNDDAFDIATANAVLEHVGSHENQRLFVSELARVSRRAFITVPNRFFPIEHHTAIPLLHFTNRGFKVACSALGKASWTDSENLILMTRKKLWRLAGDLPRSVSVGYTGLLLGPFSSNLYLAIH